MSTLKTNTLTGTTSVGSINVTGEGGSTTTNLQQGLAKGWCHMTGSGTPGLEDSLNLGSVTDTATGRFTLNISNNFGNANYACVSGIAGNDAVTTTGRSQLTDATPTTSAFAFRNVQANGDATTLNDDTNILFAFHGDLA